MTKQKAFLVKPDDQKLATMEAHQYHRPRSVLGVPTVSLELLAGYVVSNKVRMQVAARNAKMTQYNLLAEWLCWRNAYSGMGDASLKPRKAASDHMFAQPACF